MSLQSENWPTVGICWNLPALVLADGVGFEPTEDLRPRRISSPVHSTALPPIRSHPLGNPPPTLEFPLWRRHVSTGSSLFRQTADLRYAFETRGGSASLTNPASPSRGHCRRHHGSQASTRLHAGSSSAAADGRARRPGPESRPA